MIFFCCLDFRGSLFSRIQGESQAEDKIQLNSVIACELVSSAVISS